MSQPETISHRASFDQKRQALIDATLAIIGEAGIQSATVRNIADRANVTQGLIRHYFSTKEELIAAAHSYHMDQMTILSDEAASGALSNATERLSAFIQVSLSPPVLSGYSMSIWAGFTHLMQQDPVILKSHSRAYLKYRDRLEGMIEAAYRFEGKDYNHRILRQKAIACNAVLDGLWIEGCQIPESFLEGELMTIALSSISAILDLNLIEKGADK